MHGTAPYGARAMLRQRVLGDAEAAVMRSEVMRLAMPSIGEQLLNMTVQLVNTYLVGHLGAEELAAVGLSNNMMMLAQTFLMALATGTTAVVARLIGARDPRGAAHIVQQSLLMGGVTGTVLLLVMVLLAEQAIAFYDPEPAVATLGGRYLRIASLTFTMQGLMMVGNAAMRGAGDTRTPLYIMLGVNALNILVSSALLLGLGPLPALGVLGPAVGSAMALAAGGVAALVTLLRGRAGLRVERQNLSVDWPAIRRVLNVGLPAGGEQLALRLGMVLFTRLISGLGTAAYAAHQVALSAQNLAFMPGFGFSVASTTMVGQALGAKDTDKARRAVREALRVAVWAMTAVGLFLVLAADYVMVIFTDDPAVIALGGAPNKVLGALQPLAAATMVYSGALRGAGDTRWTLIITALAVWAVRIPMATLFAETLGMGLLGAWVGMGIDNVVRGVLFWLRYRTGNWTRIRV